MRSKISVCIASIGVAYAFAVRMMCVQKGIPTPLKVSHRIFPGQILSGIAPENHQHFFYSVFLLLSLMLPISASCAKPDWSMGAYGGKHFDTEPANFANGSTKYQNQFIAAVTASKNVWRDETLPLSLEIDGMVGYQFARTTAPRRGAGTCCQILKAASAWRSTAS